TERKAEYIGRLIMLQVALVELLDRFIIDEGQTYFRFGHAFARQCRPSHLPHSDTINGHAFLWTGDGNAKHVHLSTWVWFPILTSTSVRIGILAHNLHYESHEGGQARYRDGSLRPRLCWGARFLLADDARATPIIDLNPSRRHDGGFTQHFQ